METFEIHITGNDNIHEAGKHLGIKTIEVQLLTPKKEVLRVEHMTSHVVRMMDFESCKKEVDYIVNLLRPWCELERVKIECPWYEHYLEKTLYVESHFPPLLPLEIMPPLYPMSRNVKSNKLIFTTREYKEPELFKYWCYEESLELEMCLYDTNPQQDNDWFKLWE